MRGGRESVSGDDADDDDGLVILIRLLICVCLTCPEELTLKTWLADFATANVHGWCSRSSADATARLVPRPGDVRLTQETFVL